MGGLRRVFWRLINAIHPDREEANLKREVASHLRLLEDEVPDVAGCRPMTPAVPHGWPSEVSITPRSCTAMPGRSGGWTMPDGMPRMPCACSDAIRSPRPRQCCRWLSASKIDRAAGFSVASILQPEGEPASWLRFVSSCGFMRIVPDESGVGGSVSPVSQPGTDRVAAGRRLAEAGELMFT